MLGKLLNDNEIYTTGEAQEILKVSKSTIKRLLKSGMIRANKIGGQYRILGRELLRILSPTIERKGVGVYRAIKRGIRTRIKNW